MDQTYTMNWAQVITIILSILAPVAGFFFWMRKDTKSDIMDIKNETKNEFMDIKNDIKSFREEVKADLKEIKADLVIIRDRTSRLEAQEDYSRACIIELMKK
jgi:hypothetical protein